MIVSWKRNTSKERTTNQSTHADPNVGTSQSEVSHNQANLDEGNPTEDSEGADGVSSEGEKQAVGVEVRTRSCQE